MLSPNWGASTPHNVWGFLLGQSPIGSHGIMGEVEKFEKMTDSYEFLTYDSVKISALMYWHITCYLSIENLLTLLN